jgi:hypothetical protein
MKRLPFALALLVLSLAGGCLFPTESSSEFLAPVENLQASSPAAADTLQVSFFYKLSTCDELFSRMNIQTNAGGLVVEVWLKSRSHPANESCADVLRAAKEVVSVPPPRNSPFRILVRQRGPDMITWVK